MVNGAPFTLYVVASQKSMRHCKIERAKQSPPSPATHVVARHWNWMRSLVKHFEAIY